MKGVPAGTTSATPSVSGAGAQSLLLCCWHAMKEVSLLMGLVVEWAPIGNSPDSLLTPKQVLWMHCILLLRNCTLLVMITSLLT